MGSVGLALSVGLLVVFAAFIAFNVVSARRSAAEHRDEIAVEQALAQGDENTVVQAALELGDDPAAPARPDRRTVLVNGAKSVVGAVGIVVGAQLLVDNGSALARLAGVSERIIGVTIIAVGTSLPELVTTVTAIVKKQSASSVAVHCAVCPPPLNTHRLTIRRPQGDHAEASTSLGTSGLSQSFEEVGRQAPTQTWSSRLRAAGACPCRRAPRTDGRARSGESQAGNAPATCRWDVTPRTPGLPCRR